MRTKKNSLTDMRREKMARQVSSPWEGAKERVTVDHLDSTVELLGCGIVLPAAIAHADQRRCTHNLKGPQREVHSHQQKPDLHIPLSLPTTSSVTSSSAMFAGMDGLNNVWAIYSPLMVQHAKFDVH